MTKPFNKIKTSFILIHFLKNRKSCTISELVEKKFLIEKTLPTVFVDVSKLSILSCIEHYSEIFEMKDDIIYKKKKSYDYFKKPVIDFFDVGVDDYTRQNIINILNVDNKHINKTVSNFVNFIKNSFVK